MLWVGISDFWVVLVLEWHLTLLLYDWKNLVPLGSQIRRFRVKLLSLAPFSFVWCLHPKRRTRLLPAQLCWRSLEYNPLIRLTPSRVKSRNYPSSHLILRVMIQLWIRLIRSLSLLELQQRLLWTYFTEFVVVRFLSGRYLLRWDIKILICRELSAWPLSTLENRWSSLWNRISLLLTKHVAIVMRVIDLRLWNASLMADILQI